MLQRPTLPDVSRYACSPDYDACPSQNDASVPLPTASTPLPNVLVDRVMPELSDTEWRLLCVVCRQTLGYASPDGKGRRQRDWLSHRQLKSRTGRASAAVSRGIDGLVRKGLIEVRGMDGKPLVTPAERRRCQGALFFALSPGLLWDGTQGA